MNTDVINDKIRYLVRTLIRWDENTVRVANQNAPTGAKTEPFATVLITGLAGAGWDANRMANDAASTNVLSDTVGQRIATAQIQFYRLGAYQNAARLKSLLQSQSAIMAMADVGLGLVRSSNVTNVAQVINAQWEEQASVNVDFNVISLETESLHSFNKFPIYITPAEFEGTQSTISTEVYQP